MLGVTFVGNFCMIVFNSTYACTPIAEISLTGWIGYAFLSAGSTLFNYMLMIWLWIWFDTYVAKTRESKLMKLAE